ncbi:MAG: hypothetical protein ACP5D1_05695 [Bacteroidales bacterium]
MKKIILNTILILGLTGGNAMAQQEFHRLYRDNPRHEKELRNKREPVRHSFTGFRTHSESQSLRTERPARPVYFRSPAPATTLERWMLDTEVMYRSVRLSCMEYEPETRLEQWMLDFYHEEDPALEEWMVNIDQGDWLGNC